jgi:CheY-like chemotaxis protein
MRIQQARSGPHRVIVVDDEDIVLISARRILRKGGYEAVTVDSAIAALELIRDQKFDLVLSDLMMPGMSGLQLLEAMRSRGMRIPVILVTGLPTITTAMKALRLGACDYVAKPFTRMELLNPVSRALAMCDEWVPGVPVVEGRTVDASGLVEGMVLSLPRHAWARYTHEGNFVVGIEGSFIGACGRIVGMRTPTSMDLVEQGYPGLWLTNEAGEEHGVAMPLSGQVISINTPLIEDPSRIDEDTWLLSILPVQMETEVGHLLVRSS